MTAQERRSTEIYARVSVGPQLLPAARAWSAQPSQEEIKAAFRELARHYHPDQTNLENRELAERRFQEITRAYRVLSDPQRRAEYDGPIGPSADDAEATPGIDYYLALRVARDATQSQILEAYRALAYQHRVAHRQGRRVLGGALQGRQRGLPGARATRRRACSTTRSPGRRRSEKSVAGLFRRSSRRSAREVGARRARSWRPAAASSRRDELERFARLSRSRAQARSRTTR